MSDNTTEARPENVGPEGHDYGPLRTYAVFWATGDIERVQGHQITAAGSVNLFLTGNREPKWLIHGQFGKHWRCVLAADEPLIMAIRDITDTFTGSETSK